MRNVGKCIKLTQKDWSYNHNNAKHNNTICIFHGIYSRAYTDSLTSYHRMSWRFQALGLSLKMSISLFNLTGVAPATLLRRLSISERLNNSKAISSGLHISRDLVIGPHIASVNWTAKFNTAWHYAKRQAGFCIVGCSVKLAPTTRQHWPHSGHLDRWMIFACGQTESRNLPRSAVFGHRGNDFVLPPTKNVENVTMINERKYCDLFKLIGN